MASPLPEDPYEVLGVSKDFDISTLRTAHRKLVLKHHPDRVHDPHLKPQARNDFQRIQQAYELLSDPVRRSRYDIKVKLAELRKAAMERGPSVKLDGKHAPITVPAHEYRPPPCPFCGRVFSTVALGKEHNCVHEQHQESAMKPGFRLTKPRPLTSEEKNQKRIVYLATPTDSSTAEKPTGQTPDS